MVVGREPAEIQFGDGGAFAELLIPQYPRGMGLQPSTKESRSNGSGFQVQDFNSTLTVKHLQPSDLQLPNPDAVAESTRATKAALEQKVQDIAARVGNKSERRDPLDPRTKRDRTLATSSSSALVATASHDPAPIVRSPTKKKPTTSSGTDSSDSLQQVPFCVSSWVNPKNMIVPLDVRVAASHKQEAPVLAAHHTDLAMALNRAKRDVEERIARVERSEQESKEQAQSADETKALEEAQSLLQAMERSRREAQQSETREERRERLALERERREREREAKAKLRRRQDAAARLGITLDALEQDADLLKSVDDASASQVQDVRDLVDSRVHALDNDASSTNREDGNQYNEQHRSAPPAVTARELLPTTRGIEQELKVLQGMAQSKPASTTKLIETDSDDDDDIFALGNTKKTSRQKRQRTP